MHQSSGGNYLGAGFLQFLKLDKTFSTTWKERYFVVVNDRSRQPLAFDIQELEWIILPMLFPDFSDADKEFPAPPYAVRSASSISGFFDNDGVLELHFKIGAVNRKGKVRYYGVAAFKLPSTNPKQDFNPRVGTEANTEKRIDWEKVHLDLIRENVLHVNQRQPIAAFNSELLSKVALRKRKVRFRESIEYIY